MTARFAAAAHRFPARRVRQGILTLAGCQATLTAMARYGGGPETYRALTGPRRAADKGEGTFTFTSVRNVCAKMDGASWKRLVRRGASA